MTLSRKLSTLLLLASTCIASGGIANAQTLVTAQENLKLAADSPFRDPDIIYLEADELINDEGNNILTAVGEVEGRYQDKTLRADRVVYNLETGRVIATGDVVLIDAQGNSQHAEKLELSNELEAGTASNFTSRFANGGMSAAKFATRRTDDGIDLYNAYYTACVPCQEGDKPTWQLRARRVSQDTDSNMIRYKDAVFTLFDIPVFYTPYLAHPDPSAGRASGWLTPYFGVSGSRGVTVHAPYYFAINDYTDATITPRIYSNVNPMLDYQFRRRFYSGDITIEGSFTYASIFDRNGDIFEDTDTFNLPEHAPVGRRLRSHTFATGRFEINEDWDWGFGIQGASDDLYLTRYDIDKPREDQYFAAQKLISQIFTVGQDDNFRISARAFGFQDLVTRILEVEDSPDTFRIIRNDDSELPIVAPKIELDHYFKDPVLDGRFKLTGDFTSLTRKEGTNYTRGSFGADWNKTFITGMGIEAKPFANARFDYFDFKPENTDSAGFERAVGQVGADIRWPFIKHSEGVDIILEPRAQITQSFGDGKIENFTTLDEFGDELILFQDSTGVDLDQGLFWASNKSFGYDFWQEGFRADIGGAATALWNKNSASLFLGRSFASGYDDDFSATSGLAGDRSDYVGQLNVELGRNLDFNVRSRYDDGENKFTRIDTSLRYENDWFETDWRYYNIDNSLANLVDDDSIPSEEISGGVAVQFAKNWKAGYRVLHDLDRDRTTRQRFSLSYFDDCTRIDLFYTEQNLPNDAVRNAGNFGIRVSLATLGQVGSR